MDFALKKVSFLGRECVIICQNENGPCPLLAIANVLLLQNQITISSDRSFISLNDLIQIIANQILEKAAAAVSREATEAAAVMEAKMIESVFNILPKMTKGLDLNIFFDNVMHFEYTEEITVFDVLNIPLLHGWIVQSSSSNISKINTSDGITSATNVVATDSVSMDDIITNEYDLLSKYSYNKAIFHVVEYKELIEKMKHENRTLPFNEAEARLLSEGQVIESFLNRTASQLSQDGVLQLYSHMRDRQLAVFFRNNHFSTIFSLNGQLFTLMTDQGYLHEPAVVWELIVLDGVAGNSEFYNSTFTPLSSLPVAAISSSYAIQESIASEKNNIRDGGNGGTRAVPPSTQPVTSTPVTAIDFTSMLHGDSSLAADEPSENPLLPKELSGRNNKIDYSTSRAAVNSSYEATLNMPIVPVCGSVDTDELIARQLQDEEDRQASIRRSSEQNVKTSNGPRIITPSHTVAGSMEDRNRPRIIEPTHTVSAPPTRSGDNHSIEDPYAKYSQLRAQEQADREHAMKLQAEYEEYDRRNRRPVNSAQQRTSNASKSSCIIS